MAFLEKFVFFFLYSVFEEYRHFILPEPETQMGKSNITSGTIQNWFIRTLLGEELFLRIAGVALVF